MAAFGDEAEQPRQQRRVIGQELQRGVGEDEIVGRIGRPGRNVLPDELGATGTFLASDGAAAITGQVIYVDCGYQIMGM